MAGCTVFGSCSTRAPLVTRVTGIEGAFRIGYGPITSGIATVVARTQASRSKFVAPISPCEFSEAFQIVDHEASYRHVLRLVVSVEACEFDVFSEWGCVFLDPLFLIGREVSVVPLKERSHVQNVDNERDLWRGWVCRAVEETMIFPLDGPEMIIVNRLLDEIRFDLTLQFQVLLHFTEHRHDQLFGICKFMVFLGMGASFSYPRSIRRQ